MVGGVHCPVSIPEAKITLLGLLRSVVKTPAEVDQLFCQAKYCRHLTNFCPNLRLATKFVNNWQILANISFFRNIFLLLLRTNLLKSEKYNHENIWKM